MLRADKSRWGTFTPGGNFDVTFTITAYHGGMFGLYLCPWEAGATDFDYEKCGIFGKNAPAYNEDSEYFIGKFELPANYELCLNCQDETAHPRVEYAGRQWATTNGNLCGFVDPMIPIPEEGITADDLGWPKLPAGCQGKSKDGTSAHTVTVTAPSAVTTNDAVLIWHWITSNQAHTATPATYLPYSASATKHLITRSHPDLTLVSPDFPGLRHHRRGAVHELC